MDDEEGKKRGGREWRGKQWCGREAEEDGEREAERGEGWVRRYGERVRE